MTLFQPVRPFPDSPRKAFPDSMRSFTLRQIGIIMQKKEEKQIISFIIPCYASEGSVGLVIDEIREVVAQRPEFDYQVVAVNDCLPAENPFGIVAEPSCRRQINDLRKKGVFVVDISSNRLFNVA